MHTNPFNRAHSNVRKMFDQILFGKDSEMNRNGSESSLWAFGSRSSMSSTSSKTSIGSAISLKVSSWKLNKFKLTKKVKE